jgi:hypothetical protein
VQAARAFWMELQDAFKVMGYTRSAADPCLYVRWDDDDELCAWLTWIDDCIVIGNENVVARESAKLMSLFDCDDVGPMKEYIGNKIDYGPNKMKLTQPVLLKSFVDEFGVDEKKTVSLPAKAGQILVKSEPQDVLDDAGKTKYRSGVGKLRYLATWSRPDILNSVREVSRQLKAPNKVHYQAMMQIMQFCVATSKRGRKIEPNASWNGSKDFEFVISGMSDSNFNQCPDTRKSVSGNTTIVNGVPVVTKSVMQDTMKLSVTEAELESATTNVQDMLYLKQILESILLKVKLPMVLYTDSRSVIDLINNWSVGGRLRHVATKTMFLRELKELGWLVLEHTPGSLMRTDLMTKNLLKPVYEQHSSFYVTDEEFDQVEQQQARESVGIEDSERHAGGAVERKECHDERGGTHDPGIKRLQQLDVGDMEPDRRDRLKIGVEDSNIGGAIIQRGIERDRREVVTVGLKSNG